MADVDRPGGARWRVFVSHTSELREYPAGGSYVAAVERAISACGHVIVDMADFPAADQPAAQLCIDRARSCDVYVGVLGTRYGSRVRDRPGVSYTELEFATATGAGLDRLVFLLDTGAADVGIPPAALIDQQFGSRQEAFRRRVQDSGLVTQKFTDPATLGQLVERSLGELAEQHRRGAGAGQPVQGPAVVVAGDIPQQPLGFQPRAGLLAALDGPGAGSPVRVVHALTGMRGVGKTHLAAAYARARLAERWRLVGWVNAEEEAGLLAGLAEVAAVIASQHLPYATYLDRLHRLPAAGLLAPEEAGQYPHGVAAAVLLALATISAGEHGEACGAVMEMLAVLSAAGAGRSLIQAAAGLPGRDGPLPALAPDVTDRVLARLAGASLLTFSVDSSRITAHRLVMRVIREHLAARNWLTTVCQATADLLDQLARSLSDSWHQDRAAARDLAEQIMALPESAHRCPASSDLTRDNLANAYQDAGRTSEASNSNIQHSDP